MQSNIRMKILQMFFSARMNIRGRMKSKRRDIDGFIIFRDIDYIILGKGVALRSSFPHSDF